MPGLSKQERLYGQKPVASLFAHGRNLFVGKKPLQLGVRYLLEKTSEESPVPCRIMVIASKRNYKHAVTRNRIKRLLRESFRARKIEFSETVPPGFTLLLSVRFSGSPAPTFAEIDALMAQVPALLHSHLIQTRKSATDA